MRLDNPNDPFCSYRPQRYYSTPEANSFDPESTVGTTKGNVCTTITAGWNLTILLLSRGTPSTLKASSIAFDIPNSNLGVLESPKGLRQVHLLAQKYFRRQGVTVSRLFRGPFIYSLNAWSPEGYSPASAVSRLYRAKTTSSSRLPLSCGQSIVGNDHAQVIVKRVSATPNATGCNEKAASGSMQVTWHWSEAECNHTTSGQVRLAEKAAST